MHQKAKSANNGLPLVMEVSKASVSASRLESRRELSEVSLTDCLAQTGSRESTRHSPGHCGRNCNPDRQIIIVIQDEVTHKSFSLGFCCK